MLLATLALAFQSADPLLKWMDIQAQQQLDQRERTIAAIQTSADAERYRAAVRAKLVELLGGLPTYRGPLRARITGQLRAPTHIIEKVIFETLKACPASTSPAICIVRLRPAAIPQCWCPRDTRRKAGPSRNAWLPILPPRASSHSRMTRSAKASASSIICRNWGAR